MEGNREEVNAECSDINHYSLHATKQADKGKCCWVRRNIGVAKLCPNQPNNDQSANGSVLLDDQTVGTCLLTDCHARNVHTVLQALKINPHPIWVRVP